MYTCTSTPNWIGVQITVAFVTICSLDPHYIYYHQFLFINMIHIQCYVVSSPFTYIKLRGTAVASILLHAVNKFSCIQFSEQKSFDFFSVWAGVRYILYIANKCLHPFVFNSFACLWLNYNVLYMYVLKLDSSDSQCTLYIYMYLALDNMVDGLLFFFFVK